MKPTEEAPTPEQAQAMTEESRAMLVQAAAIAGLVESRCREPSHFIPMMEKGLRAIHVGEGDFRVFAVDQHGEIRQTKRGPMTPLDLANELRQDEGFNTIGWRVRTTIPAGKTTSGRKLPRWQ